MTTLRDILNDLVASTIEKINDDSGNSNSENYLTISEHEKEDLVDDAIETITARIVG